MSAEPYLSKWGLSEAEEIAQTPVGIVYKVKRDSIPAILKIYSDIGKEDEGSGKDLLVFCAGRSCVGILEHDENALLMEYLPGPNLLSFVQDGRDEEAIKIIATVLRDIHSCSLPYPDSLVTLERRFESLFDKASKSPGSLYDRAASLARELLQSQENMCALHGDMHHGNVLQDVNGYWKAIDPKGLIGDPAYDYANTLLNPMRMGDLIAEDAERLLRRVKIISQMSGIDKTKILSYGFVHACLSAAWFESNNESPDHSLKMATMMERKLNNS